MRNAVHWIPFSVAVACTGSTPQPSVPGTTPTAPTEPSCVEQTFYADADQDGAGDPAVTVLACEAPSGFVADAGDCNDADADSAPGTPETCDGTDNDCDGSVDEELPETWEYSWPSYVEWVTYDAAGLEVARARDWDLDGAVDEVDTFLYDDEGRTIEHAVDGDGDGQADLLTRIAYDAAGRERRRSWDYGADGIENWIHEIVFDKAGNPILEQTDSNGDGLFDTWTSRTFLDVGKPTVEVRSSRTLIDEYRVEHTYDEDGYRVRSDNDQDNDGSVNSWEIFTWTPDRTERTTERFGPASPDPTSRYVERYGPQGELVYWGVDREADGSIDASGETEFDDQGRVVRTRSTFDGWISNSWTTYDDALGEQTFERDDNGDGVVDFSQVTRFDALERPVYLGIGHDADGTPELEIEPVMECIP